MCAYDDGSQSLTDTIFNSGGAVSTQRLRFRSTVAGAETFPENHASSLLVARSSAQADYPDLAEHDAADDAAGKFNVSGTTRCGVDRSRDAALCKGGRDQAPAGVRFSE